MLTTKLKRLEKAQKAIDAERSKIAATLKKELKALPEQYGFSDPKLFFKAILTARDAAPEANPATEPSERKARTEITPEIENKVIAALGQKIPGRQIAKQLGISVPTVHNIKKKHGLVRARPAA